MSHKLLLIAHAFPPSGGAGVRRVIKIVKYLSEMDWEITVLAPHRGQFFSYAYDPSLCNQVPSSVRVVECFTPESWFITRTVAVGSDNGQTSSTSYLKWLFVYKRLYKNVGNLISIPESAITWLPFALYQGWKLAKRENFELIFSTAPPFSTLIISACLKELVNKPLAIEFRDAWINDPGRVIKSRWRRFLEKHQEKFSLKAADKVISVTEGVTLDLNKRYPDRSNKDKYITIPNGFDRTDYPPPKNGNPKLSLNFNIVYTGTLGGKRTPKYFLEALQFLLNNKPQLDKKIKLILVGVCSQFEDGKYINDYISEFQLENIVELTGFVSREKSLEYQSKADLLLLLVGDIAESESQCYGLSGKVFDYILSEKPILTIGEGGPTEDLVKSAKIGEVVSHHDQKGIASTLERAIEGNLKYDPDYTVIDRYDIANIMERLDHVLKSMIDTNKGKIPVI